jgi:hypothetical protein
MNFLLLLLLFRLVPLWSRQIPYTMMKFWAFERTVEALYKHVVPKPKVFSLSLFGYTYYYSYYYKHNQTCFILL